MCSEGYSSYLVSVCVSVILIPANRAIRPPTKGSSITTDILTGKEGDVDVQATTQRLNEIIQDQSAIPQLVTSLLENGSNSSSLLMQCFERSPALLK